jgi:hypothetical protein
MLDKMTHELTLFPVDEHGPTEQQTEYLLHTFTVQAE